MKSFLKKALLSLAATLTLTAGARADEGMWLLPLLQKMNAGAMAELGCRLTPEQIYSINNTSLKDAIVHFGGGCTGEMISNQGLVITNHHCGYSNIQALSTPEHNYLEDGYWAMNLKEELPARGLSVTFLVSMSDVTSVIEKAYESALKANKKAEDKEEIAEAAMEAAAIALAEKAEADNPHCTARVQSFYNDNVFYLIVYKTYTDIRFVGAPPASSGKFGGETDNWMWPRHTCDFSMFRVYAGPDNEPADYSENNVPYRPKKTLGVSLKGYQDGDFAMIMGYPGRTQRFQTAAQLKQMIATQRIAIDARTVRQDVMWDARMADPAVNLQYASKYASSSNGWKKWQGEELAFQKLNIIGREEQKEADFNAWASAKKKRKEAYGNAIQTIADAVEASAEAEKAYTLLTESIYRIEAVNFAASFGSAFRRSLASGKDSTAALEDAISTISRQYKDYYEPLDRKEGVALFNHYLSRVKPEDMVAIDGLDPSQVEPFVTYLFDNTAFTSEEKIREKIKSWSDFTDDPATMVYNAIVGAAQKLAPAMNASAGPIAEGSKAFTKGLMEWKADEPSYPDANSTMRLTYGTVKSYSPQDGVLYKHYTTLKGVIEKENNDDYEFRVPAKLHEIYVNKDYGQYANEKGELPACFLINCDITGGNSGSPVMDADGNLIGLAFDGNWESMSSDVMFEPDLQRCICVDIRYVLLLLDKFGGAGYLLNEMNIIK
ncbi:MAG: S46 family peptidase [Bacteroidales bacterium]|nr:S46 family peptidase [Bacteroidales bacterium]